MAEMLTLETFEEASLKVKEVTQETKLIESADDDLHRRKVNAHLLVHGGAHYA